MTAELRASSSAWNVQPDTPPLDAALAYARAGFRVAWINGVVINAETGKSFCTCRNKKCNSHGKHPVLTAWQRAASSDPEVLRDQHSRLAFVPNVGIVLGDGTISIDVDDAERLTALEGELGTLPQTLTGRSARGARLFFRAPSDRIKNHTALGDRPGVDVKSTGGQVVVAPSLHSSGARYTWDYPLTAVASLPEAWVLYLLPKEKPIPPALQGYTPGTIRLDKQAKRRAEKYLQRATTDETSLLARTGEGGRNTALHVVLCRLLPLAHGLALSTGHAFVIQECTRAAFAAGLGEREVSRTIASVEKWMTDTGVVRVPYLVPEQPSNAEPVSPPEHEPVSLTLDASRKPAKLASNVSEILKSDPMWKGGPRFDSVSMLTLWPMPLPEPIADIYRLDREIVDADYDAIAEYCYRVHECRVGHELSQRGVRFAAASGKPMDTLREEVDRLPKWDGTKRMRTWTSRYLGCPNDEYHQHMGAAWLASAMHRAVTPGDVVDLIPILMGKQKAGKNRAIEILFSGGPKAAPFLAPLGSWRPDHDDTKRLACSRWVLHDDEFSARDVRTVDSLKSWASRSLEQWTPKYANDVVARYRRCVLVLSVNHDVVLQDPTGARRFGPLHVGEIDFDGLRAARDQLLAEALTHQAHWRELLPADELQEEVTSAATAEDGLETAIMGLTDWPECGLSSFELGTRCGMRPEALDRKGTTRLGIAAKKAGCRVFRVGPGRVRMYERPT